jgi:hypothetical protein
MALEDLTSMADPVTKRLQRFSAKAGEPATMTNAMAKDSLARRSKLGEMARQELPELMIERQRQAEKDFQEQAGLRTQMAEKQKVLGEQFAVKEKALIEKPEYQQKEIPLFAPSESSLEDIRNIMGLSVVAGFLVGGASKRSGNLGLAALNGAMDGFRQGRQDVYKRELDVFTKSVEAIKENNRQILDRFNKAMGLLQTDRKAAEGELKVLEAQVDNSAAKALLAQGRFQDAEKVFRAAVEAGDKADDFGLRLQEKAAAEARARSDKLSLANQNFVLKLADFNRKVDQDRAKAITLNPKEQEQLRGLDNLKAELEDLQRMALSKPEKFFGFGTDMAGNVVAQYRQKFLQDPEMQNFIRRFEAFQIPDRHDAFGATLTGNERDSWRRSIIGPGDDPSAVPEYFATKLMILERARNNIINNPYRATQPQAAGAQLNAAAGQAANMGVNLGSLGSFTFQPPQQQPQAQSQQQQAISAFGSYEPDKYEYGTNPATGKFARRPRSQ